MEELISGVSKASQKLDLEEELLELLKPQNLVDNYDCLDWDDSGLIDKHEFVQGCLAMLTKPNTPMELLQVLHLARSTRLHLQLIVRKVDKLPRASHHHKRRTTR